jgi:hypothetical protein
MQGKGKQTYMMCMDLLLLHTAVILVFSQMKHSPLSQQALISGHMLTGNFLLVYVSIPCIPCNPSF